MNKVEKIPYPHPIPFPRIHRCGRPVLHSLAVVSVLVGWLWFSIATRGMWGLKLAAVLDPRKVGYGLPIAVLAELFWLGLIPLACVPLYFLSMWRCTGARAHPALRSIVAEALHEPVGGQPTMVERIVVPEAVAAQHGLPPGTIVERIHYT